MFQFRAFPSYGYLIHRTMTGYCPAVFPHSEISGLSRICRSPKLIAACHVLLRLLMPRHSPCALISLTFRQRPVDVGSLELCRFQQKFSFNKIVFTLKLKSSTMLFLVAAAASPRSALCCLAFFLLCSVFKVHLRLIVGGGE